MAAAPFRDRVVHHAIVRVIERPSPLLRKHRPRDKLERVKQIYPKLFFLLDGHFSRFPGRTQIR